MPDHGMLPTYSVSAGCSVFSYSKLIVVQRDLDFQLPAVPARCTLSLGLAPAEQGSQHQQQNDVSRRQTQQQLSYRMKSAGREPSKQTQETISMQGSALMLARHWPEGLRKTIVTAAQSALEGNTPAHSEMRALECAC
eukprot:1150536-Pelagomonas_calceolata.AAC.2